MKPIIGVMSLWYEERNSIWMLPGYMESINQVVKKVAPGLNTMAVSQDGIIEAKFKPDQRFLWAVQWHPEFSYKTDENSMKIFQAFDNSMIYSDAC